MPRYEEVWKMHCDGKAEAARRRSELRIYEDGD